MRAASGGMLTKPHTCRDGHSDLHKHPAQGGGSWSRAGEALVPLPLPAAGVGWECGAQPRASSLSVPTFLGPLLTAQGSSQVLQQLQSLTVHATNRLVGVGEAQSPVPPCMAQRECGLRGSWPSAPQSSFLSLMPESMGRTSSASPDMHPQPPPRLPAAPVLCLCHVSLAALPKAAASPPHPCHAWGSAGSCQHHCQPGTPLLLVPAAQSPPPRRTRQGAGTAQPLEWGRELQILHGRQERTPTLPWPCESCSHAGCSHAERSMQQGLGGALPSTDVSSGRGSMAGKKGGEQRHHSMCWVEGPSTTGWRHIQGWPDRTTEAGSTLSSPSRGRCSGARGGTSTRMAATRCPPPEPFTPAPARSRPQCWGTG